MSFLFTVEGTVAKPFTETLLIEPYKTIWERDKTKDKEIAIKEFTFIEFMSSKKSSNPYAGYADDEREEILKETLFNKDWKYDPLVEKAMSDLVKFQTEASITYSYFNAAVIGAQEMKSFFLTFDMNERNKAGYPVYKPRDITSAIIDTERALSTLDALQEKVDKELFGISRTRGDKTINLFEI